MPTEDSPIPPPGTLAEASVRNVSISHWLWRRRTWAGFFMLASLSD
jgi:hypothetical protein